MILRPRQQTLPCAVRTALSPLSSPPSFGPWALSTLLFSFQVFSRLFSLSLKGRCLVAVGGDALGAADPEAPLASPKTSKKIFLWAALRRSANGLSFFLCRRSGVAVIVVALTDETAPTRRRTTTTRQKTPAGADRKQSDCDDDNHDDDKGGRQR
ncbi:hypothetical protein pclt_cds_1207 [Pandoravirus celtis]|uniref:Uncharacterized protein n=1 Tax=Pandoravirus celtis TaxID=2568002 RepID=A0A4D6EJ50_9VIRU|nr:hypothetical protein pclt_cds_1207 [Pandoravirus celtis]